MVAPTRRLVYLVATLLWACKAGAFASSFQPESATSPLPHSAAGVSHRATQLTHSASSDNQQEETASLLPSTVPDKPTLAQFRKFAIPCLGLWVSGPLLSLVDTSFIGLSGSAATSARQLAALGPATTFFDGATYLFMFLNVATTNLYSSARAQHGDQSDESESVVRTAGYVALRCGLGLMLFLLTAAKPLLRMYIGSEAANTPGLLQSATDYVHIRALSMPTSLVLGVLQAALLGSQDSVTPLVAILYSTTVNILGDFLLVRVLNKGLQGAALATTLAQWAATAALFRAARRKLVRDGKLGILQKVRAKVNGETGKQITGRAFLGFAAPVLTLILGKLAAFGFMTHSAAAAPGQPTPLAVHQIILSLLFFCSPFLEVISQTAQTFLPPFLAPIQNHVAAAKAADPSYESAQDSQIQPWLATGQTVATQLLGLGLLSATVVATAACLIPAKFGNVITQDPVVQQAVKPLAKFLWLGTFFWAPTAVGEGVLLARRELSFLAGVYLVSTALLPPALLRIKHQQGTVAQVWACFSIFQIFRASCFALRIWGGPVWTSVVQRLGSRASRSKRTNGEIQQA